MRKILKSKLNIGNFIKAINSWAVLIVRYTAEIIDWMQAELEDLDRKTRKLMSAHHALHPQSDVDRLYLTRQASERGLLQIRLTVKEEKRALNDYIKTAQNTLWKQSLTKSYLERMNRKANVKEKAKESLKKSCARINLFVVSTLRTSKIKLIMTLHRVGWKTVN